MQNSKLLNLQVAFLMQTNDGWSIPSQVTMRPGRLVIVRWSLTVLIWSISSIGQSCQSPVMLKQPRHSKTPWLLWMIWMIWMHEVLMPFIIVSHPWAVSETEMILDRKDWCWGFHKWGYPPRAPHFRKPPFVGWFIHIRSWDHGKQFLCIKNQFLWHVQCECLGADALVTEAYCLTCFYCNLNGQESDSTDPCLVFCLLRWSHRPVAIL